MLLQRISRAGANHERLAERAIKNPALLEELLPGLGAKAARAKFGSAKVLRLVSQEAPHLLYSHFDFFVRLLDTENKILHWEAITVHVVRKVHQAQLQPARRACHVQQPQLHPLRLAGSIEYAQLYISAAQKLEG